jgi:hypothetical protein
MTRNLSGPEREIHDTAVRWIAANRFPFPGQTTWKPDNVTITNETEQRRGIPTPDGTHYPDIVIVGGDGEIRETAEVEVDVRPEYARYWKQSSEASDNETEGRVKHFFVYVPEGLEDEARLVLGEHQISFAGLRTYRVDDDGAVTVTPIVTPGNREDHR